MVIFTGGFFDPPTHQDRFILILFECTGTKYFMIDVLNLNVAGGTTTCGSPVTWWPAPLLGLVPVVAVCSAGSVNLLLPSAVYSQSAVYLYTSTIVYKNHHNYR